jgi:carboxyl-terminal processing protease
MNRVIRASALLLVWTIAFGAAARRDYPASSREIIEIVRENFYDAQRARTWAHEHADYARSATDEQSFVRLTREALADLKASHTAYYTIDDVEYFGLRSIFAEPLEIREPTCDGIGVDVTRDGFVRVVFARGPAADAGLRRGDRILEADGQPFHAVRSFRDKARHVVTLRVQRHADAPPIELRVTPHRVNPQDQWLEHQIHGTRIIERGGRKIGYIPMFSGAGEQYELAVRAALMTMNDLDALVLDMRYGWGGLSPTFVQLFDPAVPLMTNINRDGEHQHVDRGFRAEVFILTGPGTRSGKEVVCHTLQKHRRAKLVGAKTAGAVLGGRPFLLTDGSLLMVAVTDVRTDGERLEGLGVKPDIEALDPIEFADGLDPLLERALQLASE